MERVLYLDLETSGIHPGLREEPPVHGNPEWPVFSQIAAMLCMEDGQPRCFMNKRVRIPDGRHMMAGATATHGVSSREAQIEGIAELLAIAELCGLLMQTTYVVGHNVSFDRKILLNRLRLLKPEEMEILRTLGGTERVLMRRGLIWRDTMLIGTAACKIPSEHESGTYRWPSLRRACEILLGDEPLAEGEEEQPHDAWEDVMSTQRLFVELWSRGVVDHD